MPTTDEDKKFLAVAIAEARLGRSEGGIPIGAALVVDGNVLAVGHNRRVQHGSAIHTVKQTRWKRGPAVSLGVCALTMYTTLSPCHMCAGAILLYKIPRVVIGENRTFMGLRLLRLNGVGGGAQRQDMRGDDGRIHCRRARLWNEDIGEDD